MSVVVVRYRTRAEQADENQALVEKVFAELAATQPAGLARPAGPRGGMA